MKIRVGWVEGRFAPKPNEYRIRPKMLGCAALHPTYKTAGITVQYRITRHAQDTMAKRGITIAWLEMALFSPQLREPDATDPELEHRLVVIAEYGQRVLRVVVNIESEPERVVTAFFDRSMRGKL